MTETAGGCITKDALKAAHLCFVYGTLKQGFHNHHVMQRAGGRYIGPAVLPNHRMFSLGGFPGVVPTNEAISPVHGELYAVADWTPLDRLEGYRPADPDNSMYVRRMVTVQTPDNGPTLTGAYIWNGRDMDWPNINSGVWV